MTTPFFKDFKERQEKRVPNERQLVPYIREKLMKSGLYDLLPHDRLTGGYDVMLKEKSSGAVVGVEIKSLMHTT